MNNKKKSTQSGQFTRKYRPKLLVKMVDNTAAINDLRKLIVKDSGRPSTYLFHGPSGCGKTTIARIYASHLGARDYYDIREINCSVDRGVEKIQKYMYEVYYAPRGDARVFIFDEGHRLTPEAQDSMLKILEEGPLNVYFIFCTTNPKKLNDTIRSRCVQFKLDRLSKEGSLQLLKKVCKAEGRNDISNDILESIAEKADRIPRIMLNLLERVILS